MYWTNRSRNQKRSVNLREASMNPSLMSGSNLSLPYRMSSTNNSYERLEKSIGGNIGLRLWKNAAGEPKLCPSPTKTSLSLKSLRDQHS